MHMAFELAKGSKIFLCLCQKLQEITFKRRMRAVLSADRQLNEAPDAVAD